VTATRLLAGEPLGVLDEDHVALVTSGEGAERLGVRPDRIRDWKRRQLVQVWDWTSDGRPLFSLAELWDVEHATRTGQGARRTG
jgi:hypothetical protein